jgi:hypothetical protein
MHVRPRDLSATSFHMGVVALISLALPLGWLLVGPVARVAAVATGFMSLRLGISRRAVAGIVLGAIGFVASAAWFFAVRDIVGDVVRTLDVG